jgi:hypothetical protein
MTRQTLNPLNPLTRPAGVSADRWDMALAAALAADPALWDDDQALANTAAAIVESGVAL